MTRSIPPVRARVLLIAPGELWGGVEQCVAILAAELKADDRLAGVVTLFRGPLADRLREAGLPVHIADTGHAFGSLIRTLRRVVKLTAPSVIHAHGYKAVIACGLASSLPLVRTIHGQVEPGALIDVVKLHGYETVASTIARARRAWSIYVSDHLRGDGARGRAREARIHNGVELPSAVARAASAAGPLKIGIVGRVTEVKGHDIALSALATLPRGAFHLLIAGDGPSRSAIEELAGRLRLYGDVTFLGFVPNMSRFYAELDALVMPSRNEGIPFALLEAMAYGLPVVASRVGGIPEVVRHGHDGLLIDAGAPEQLAACLSLLSANPEERLRIGAAARQTISARFSSKHMVAQHIDFYESVLRSPHGGSSLGRL